jgi:hypothetical protein
MTYKTRFCAEDFLRVIDTDEQMCVKEMCKRVGCGQSTGTRILSELAAENKIKRVYLEGTRYFYYVRNN